MKRMFLALAASLCFIGAVTAEEPKFFLTPEGKVEQRVVAVENEVASLKARVAELEKQLQVKPAVAAPATKAEKAEIVYQVCVNGRCQTFSTTDPASVPLGAKILSSTMASVGAPCPTGPCGDNCQCATMTGATSFSEDSGRTGWFPGKRIVGRLRGGGCCGQ